ncbi:hypothetical protein TNCT_155611 [Trichonephila clavata]|uniref:Uncharacterized protein n=1 Tax=Trichonephila clavata TaxID=2740835 RepID=A0A8X6IGB9_TRICU|nr:hypothetical protein TNCT_155611 [Trichonephila clavata]
MKSMDHEAKKWVEHHKSFLARGNLPAIGLHGRSDGMVDRWKTANYLIQSDILEISEIQTCLQLLAGRKCYALLRRNVYRH